MRRYEPQPDRVFTPCTIIETELITTFVDDNGKIISQFARGIS